VNGNYGSYSYNVFGATEIEANADPFALGVGWAAVGQVPPHSETQVVAPSELFALMDAKAVFPYSAGIQYGIQDYIGSGRSGHPWTECNGLYAQSSGLASVMGDIGDAFMYSNKGFNLPIAHGQVFNVVCADGHVSAIPASLVFNLTNSAANWNVDHQPHPEFWDASGGKP
jgi:hypothetical protein